MFIPKIRYEHIVLNDEYITKRGIHVGRICAHKHAKSSYADTVSMKTQTCRLLKEHI